MIKDYQQIVSANERVHRIELKGKKYANVAARVQAFRELCPDGSITSDYTVHEIGGKIIWIVKTTVCDETGKVLSTGLAYEVEGSTQVNRTSALENAETSAAGRALGMIGLGSETSMASAEEMANALYQQAEIEKAESQALWVDSTGEHTYEEKLRIDIAAVKAMLEEHPELKEKVKAKLSREGITIDDLPLKRVQDLKVQIARYVNGDQGK